MLLAALLSPTVPASAQDDDDLIATIEALETRVADQATTIAELAPATPTAAATPMTPASPGSGRAPQSLTDAFDLLYYYFVQADDGIYIFGELQNVSDTAQIAPSVVLTLITEDGTAYGSESVFPVSRYVPAGGKMPIQALDLLGGALLLGDWAEETISAGDALGTIDELDPAGLEIRDVTMGDFGSIDGRLYNTGSQPVSDISVYTFHYDASGTFVGACTGYLDVTIPPQGDVRIEGGDCGFSYVAKDASSAGEPFTFELIVGKR